MRLLKHLFFTVSKKNLTSVCCLLAYLVLLIHDITPHHHEEDLAAHHHGHVHDPINHHHHAGDTEDEIRLAHEQQGCMLFVHHVHSEDAFVSAAGSKKKVYTDYFLQYNTEQQHVIASAAPQQFARLHIDPLLRSAQTAGSRGPPTV